MLRLQQVKSPCYDSFKLLNIYCILVVSVDLHLFEFIQKSDQIAICFIISYCSAAQINLTVCIRNQQSRLAIQAHSDTYKLQSNKILVPFHVYNIRGNKEEPIFSSTPTFNTYYLCFKVSKTMSYSSFWLISYKCVHLYICMYTIHASKLFY